MKFDDIKKFPQAHYEVTQSWRDVETWLGHYVEDLKLDLDPDFQRPHVWTKKQQIAFVEYGLCGGEGGMVLYLNHPGWMASFKGDFVIVDGKQRLEAVRAFVRGDIPAFGHLCSEYTDRLGITSPSFRLRIACLKTRADMLRWYLGINAGGTPHRKEDLDKVRALLEIESVK